MKEKHYNDYQELLEKAKQLDVVELFQQTYDKGYSAGYDDAVDRLIKRS